MTDLRSDMGFTRAWVRLALECKTLSSDLKELLADTGLLRCLPNNAYRCFLCLLD